LVWLERIPPFRCINYIHNCHNLPLIFCHAQDTRYIGTLYVHRIYYYEMYVTCAVLPEFHRHPDIRTPPTATPRFSAPSSTNLTSLSKDIVWFLTLQAKAYATGSANFLRTITSSNELLDGSSALHQLGTDRSVRKSLHSHHQCRMKLINTQLRRRRNR